MGFYIDNNFNPKFETLDEFINRIIRAQPREFRNIYQKKFQDWINKEPLEYLKLCHEWEQAQFEQFDKIMNRPPKVIMKNTGEIEVLHE